MEAFARPAEIPASADQRVMMHGLRWADYEILLAIRGEKSTPRYTFFRGTLEIMSPSIDHERVKKNLARILETWAFLNEVDLTGVGSWTLRSAPKERGLEPDECYFLGQHQKARPDIAIEVVFTSGGMDKLPIYEGLGVPEVWIWEAGEIQVWELGEHGYAQRAGSGLVPSLDLPRLAACAAIENQVQAVKRFLGTESLG
ncbi:MAG: Uma2 family endonuclease [Myxococcota bacterium]